MNPKEFYEKVLKEVDDTGIGDELKDEEPYTVFVRNCHHLSLVLGATVLEEIFYQGQANYSSIDKDRLEESVSDLVTCNINLLKEGFNELKEWIKFQKEHAEEIEKMGENNG